MPKLFYRMFRKNIVVLFVFFLPFVLLAQDAKTIRRSANREAASQQNDTIATRNKRVITSSVQATDTVATIDMYKIVTLQKDTTLVDTSLTIQNEYKINYLRRDNFGLLPFSNEGQPYNILDYGLTDYNPFPDFGFRGKHFAYQKADEVNYYNVATPYTDLMYRSVLQQGQIMDALFTVNTSERLNLFVGYRGIRSIGRYINQRASHGIFKIGGSYNTTDKRYYLKVHFSGQDFTNQENGGIVDTEFFESGEDLYTDRERLDVYSRDAESVLKGNRYFFDHTFRLSKSNPNSLLFHHQFTYENEFFNYREPTVNSRYGESYTSSINNRARYNRMYNLLGAAYTNETIGTFEFYLEDFNYNYYYRSIILEDNSVSIPNALNDRINTYGAKYYYQKGKVKGSALISNSITDQSLTNIDLQARYTIDDRNVLSARYQNMNRLPNHNYNLHQSDYKAYNWSNNFNNEKINTLEVGAKTQWVDASLQYTILNDHLYFSNDFVPNAEITTVLDTLLVTPKQYGNTINYLSLKVGREFKFWKLALDNTMLYQNVQQSNNILNVPQFVTRNTLYYSDYLFKKALFIQTGFTFQYFTEYYANDYNPVIGEFYVQEQKKIGGYPLIDFFLNMKIKTFRLYLKAEHFNSSFTGSNFYSAPNYPYRDFTIRFGVVWNFFT